MSGTKLQDEFRELRRSLEAIPEVEEPPKSTLRVLGLSRSEKSWNSLLKYFLDPSQPHGFKADLLKSFLDKLTTETTIDLDYIHRDLDRVELDIEVTGDEGRPDIVVRVPGKWFICIECKVDAGETNGQLGRYLQDPMLGNTEKSEFPTGGHHYVYISKSLASDANTSVRITKENAPTNLQEKYFLRENTPDVYEKEFVDLYWEQVADAFSEEVKFSRGQYPERSVSQVDDFLTNIQRVTMTREDKFTETQKEKVQLLDEYRNDIQELFDAADALRKPLVEDGEWAERFLNIAKNSEFWSDEWHCRSDKWGCIFRDGWYLDNDWNPTTDHTATRGGPGHRLHFTHHIRKEESFRNGVLRMYLVSPTSNEIREEFNALYQSEEWRGEIEKVCEKYGINNRSLQKTYTKASYDVDQSRLPDSYFETLLTAFEEHKEIADIANRIHQKALEKARPLE